MKKLGVIFLIFCSLCKISYAQSPHLDSLKLLLQSHPTEDTIKAELLIKICWAHVTQTNDMDQVEHYNSLLLPLTEKLKFSKGIAYSYLYKGMVYKTHADYTQAVLYDKRALEIFQQLNLQAGIASCYMNLGIVEYNTGHYANSIQYYNQAIAIRTKLGDKRGLASTMNNLANTYQNIGDYKRALEYHFKSLELRESIQDKLGMSFSFQNIANSYLVQGKMDESEKFLRKALPIKKEVGDKDGESGVYSNLASIATNRKNYNEALVLYLMALKLEKEINDPQGISYMYKLIGWNYQNQDKNNEAISYFTQARTSSIAITDKADWLEADIGLGVCYEAKKKFDIAISFLEEALTLARETGIKGSEQDATSHLASVYEKMADYKRALYYQVQSTQIKDSLLNEASLKQAAELNTRYETDKKEKEILLLTKDQQLKNKALKQQQLVRTGLIIGLALLLALSFLLFNRYRFKKKANAILEKQKQEITTKNMQITDSIDYAKTIQEAILPDDEKIKTAFPEHFILYKPKAIVSGDFYWIGKKGDLIICAVADCTGHGVPGAFMSLLGHNILENVVQREESVNPGAILTTLNEEIVNRFSKDGKHETVKHAMDIAIISVNTKIQQLEYAGAQNSLYLVSQNQLTEIKADKLSTGVVSNDHRQVQYNNHSIQIRKGDMIYLFSDGFPDQKGGSHKKKFYYQPFKELLTKISSLPVPEQKGHLEKTLVDWIGNGEQIDDILIMGIRVV